MTTPSYAPAGPHFLKKIDPDALGILQKLAQNGYQAYLVGGGVRDLLLNRTPKDFDIATSARPNDVRRLFRNSRQIGRRFRLVHVTFGRGKQIEVATFRQEPSPQTGQRKSTALITDDNEFGDPKSDAFRRDFTVNALFYDPQKNQVIDYTGGLEDLQAGLLRSIGDPVVRFREDPVRMLRAVKFSARLGLDLHEPCAQAMLSQRYTLSQTPTSRLNQELERLLTGGAARRSIELLSKYQLLELFLPEVALYLGRPGSDPWPPLLRLLDAYDDALADGITPDYGLALACLYWPICQAALQQFSGQPNSAKVRDLADHLITPLANRFHPANVELDKVGAILEGQYLIEPAQSQRAVRKQIAQSGQLSTLLAFSKIRAQAETLPEDYLRFWRALEVEFPPTYRPYAHARPVRRRPRRAH